MRDRLAVRSLKLIPWPNEDQIDFAQRVSHTIQDHVNKGSKIHHAFLTYRLTSEHTNRLSVWPGEGGIEFAGRVGQELINLTRGSRKIEKVVITYNRYSAVELGEPVVRVVDDEAERILREGVPIAHVSRWMRVKAWFSPQKLRVVENQAIFYKEIGDKILITKVQP